MHAEHHDAFVDHADGGRVRLCGRGPPGAAPDLLFGAKGGWEMSKLMESLRLLLTKMRRLVTRPRGAPKG